MKILRLVRQPNALNVLVTVGDLDITRLHKKYNVIQWGKPGAMAKNVLIDEVASVHGLLCLLRDRIDSEVLIAAKNLRVISTLSAGYDHIDVDECKRRGIIIMNTPDVLTEATAETTVALLLATARRLSEAIDGAKTGKWGTWSLYYMCDVSVHHSTVGIIGIGRIGFSVAQKLKAFNRARILYHNRKPNKKSALINQEDLYAALSSHRIRAAALDVTTPEPLPTNSPLFSLKNCVILPHIGSATELARNEMLQLAEDDVLTVLDVSELSQHLRVV